MNIEVPYGKDKIGVKIDDARVAGIVVGNNVPIGDENETIVHLAFFMGISASPVSEVLRI